MKYTFNDGSVLELKGLDAYFISAEFRLFTGSELPTMELVVQYGDDSQHWLIGEEISGSLSDSGGNNEFKGYVFDMREGSTVTYKVILRPLEYFTKEDADRYDSIQSAIEAYEKLDYGKLTDKADGVVHGFSDYGCNIVDRAAQGLAKGVYARSWDKLIMRDPENDESDLSPELQNVTIKGVIDQVSNKYKDKTPSTEESDEWRISSSGGYVTYKSDYQQFYENALHNKRFNLGSLLELECMALLPFEPGMIVDTSSINAYNDTNIPKMMYVRDVIINIDKSNTKMKVILAS